MRLALLLVLVLQGCCMDAAGFVATQRAFFSVVEPEYREYVTNDPELDPEQKASRFDLLDAEEAVLTEAEAGL